MSPIDFIKSLKIDDNIFELKKDTYISYIVHFYAPFPGKGKIMVPKGTKFVPFRPRAYNELYMQMIGENEVLFDRMIEKEKLNYEDWAEKLSGDFSFFITEQEVKRFDIHFITGSKRRLYHKLITGY